MEDTKFKSFPKKRKLPLGNNKKIRAPLRASTRNISIETLDEEDQEIERLEKLLGLKGKKDREKVVSKLGKEFEEFEGIGDGDFGEFLESLESISKIQKLDSNKGDLVENQNYDSKNIVDQENIEDLNDQITGDHESEAEGEEVHKDNIQAKNTYAPVKGEDIYGRSLGSSGKYVPPAKRNLLIEDMKSPDSPDLQRQITGLLNKLSLQTRDPITRSLRSLFESHPSVTCCLALRLSLLSLCDHPPETLRQLLPVYAATLAVLHAVVGGGDVGGILIESIVRTLCLSSPSDPLPSPQLAVNLLFLLLHLYTHRTVDHVLVFELVEEFLTGRTALSSRGRQHLMRKNSPPANESEVERPGEEELSVLCDVLDLCGPQLRSDDFPRLKALLAQPLSVATPDLNAGPPPFPSPTSRQSFLLARIQAFLTNKSRRDGPAADALQASRRWVGTTRSALQGGGGADPCLHVPLKDFMQADLRGRWWRAGSSWRGREPEPSPSSSPSHSNAIGSSPHSPVTSRAKEEGETLLSVAEKLKLTTPTRKAVFLAVAGSGDVDEAFERLAKLGLKGRQDRDVPLVLLECCGRERTYNPFYAELLALLCADNRQTRTTVQYLLWDAFKDFEGGEGDKDARKKRLSLLQRKSSNLGRLLGLLVTRFLAPLSILRPLPLGLSLPPSSQAFLTHLFLSIFTSKVTDESLSLVFDRVASSPDFEALRDGLTAYLKNQFTPSSLSSLILPSELELLKARRAAALKTLRAMSILSFKKDEDERERGRRSEGDDEEVY